MKHPSALTFAIVSSMLFGENQAFCPQQQQHQGSSAASSSLSLLPGQGNQLAAAFTASISREELDEDVVRATPIAEPPSSSSHWRALAASRSFVARVFHLPSSSIQKHPHPTLEGLKENHNNGGHSFPFNFIPRVHQHDEKEEDAVYYPLVGFQFVKCQSVLDDSVKTIVLPTTCHAACRLPTNRNEEVYGWFSPACKLDLYSEDVCHKP